MFAAFLLFTTNKHYSSSWLEVPSLQQFPVSDKGLHKIYQNENTMCTTSDDVLSYAVATLFPKDVMRYSRTKSRHTCTRTGNPTKHKIVHTLVSP